MTYSINGLPHLAYHLGHKYYRGPHGVGVYTVHPDEDGNYHVLYARPSGVGARKAFPKQYTHVVRFDTTRKSKSAAIDRAYVMAYGKVRREKKPKPERRNLPETAYCMAEKKHVTIKEWKQIKAKNGRDMLQALCPDCGTRVSKYGKLIDCPECGETKPGASDDYLCKSCRASA